MLDVETAMCDKMPPCIHDDDIDWLLIEPPKFTYGGHGIVQSSTGVTLSLYSARQRLARIAGLILNEVYTSRGRHLPSNLRDETARRLNAKLQDWKAEWFAYGRATEVSQEWQESVLVHIANLQFTFFQCLLRANPDMASTAVDVCNIVKDGDDLPLIPTHCLDAARGALRLAMAIRNGEAAYIRYGFTEVFIVQH